MNKGTNSNTEVRTCRNPVSWLREGPTLSPNPNYLLLTFANGFLLNLNSIQERVYPLTLIRVRYYSVLLTFAANGFQLEFNTGTR